ncbi:MAG: leucine-rich repeat domain-containing protein, partial [Clostridia bacterium]|nr:leucine-rich repeat domain-containing protein [Clostridia bacterium]
MIEKIVIGEGVTSIGDGAFHGLSSVESVEMADTVTSIGEYAFLDCTWLDEIYIPESVTHIEYTAFHQWEDMSGTSYPLDYLTLRGEAGSYVQRFAEENYLSFEPVLRPDENGILVSGTCGDSLTWTLNVDGLLTVTGSGAMDDYPDWQSYADLITSVSLPDGLTTIGMDAFYGCTGLTEAVIPDSVTAIGWNAFRNCTSLTDVTVGSGVQTIDSFAFATTDLTEITLPASLTSLSYRVFAFSYDLTDITFLGGAPTIDDSAFQYAGEATCYYPDNGTWPSSALQQYGGTLTWVPYAAEEEEPADNICGDDLTWSLENGVLTISGSGAMYDYQSTATPWNPADIREIVFDDDCTITWIGMAAFAGCTGLTAIDIPDTVTTIATEAFRGCTNLASVSLPEELTIIGGMAFYGCTALTEITVPAKVVSISNVAFASSGLESITMLGSEPNLGMFVFQGCDLTTYANWDNVVSTQWGTVLPIGGATPEVPAEITWTFADGLLTISGNGAMPDYAAGEAPWTAHAAETTKIIIEDGITSIGAYAFVEFNALKLAEISADVQTVGDYAFYYQSGETATRILFKGEAPDISQLAFADRYNTVGVYMEGTESWEEEIGDYYANLNWLSMDENGIIEEGTCDENLSWTIDLDGTLTISGSGSLVWGIWPVAPYENIIIEEGITAIGDYAFCMTGMTSVTIPASVTVIGERAFDENLRLEEITFLGNPPAIGENAFAYAGFYNGATVYYPDNGTWTEENRLQYGGVLNWVPYEVETEPDTVAPILSITGPENGSRVWGSAVLEVSATDEDENVTTTVRGAVGETVLTAQQRGEQYT